MLQQTRRFLRDIWTLAKPYWYSEERWSARLLLAAIVVLNLGLVGITVLLNQWNNAFYNALQDKDYDAFVTQLLYFTGLAAMFIAVAVYRLYLNQMLQIRWRRWLTDRYLGEWLGGQTYYRLQLAENGTDNPDQRIAEDLRLFVSLTLSLSLGLMSAVVTLVSFLGILWTLSGTLSIPWGDGTIDIPGYMVWVAIAYSIAGTALTHVIGRPLTHLNFDQQRFEADFRFSLVRFRENAESIALQGGEADEARAFRQRFGDVVANWWAIMRCQKRLTWFTAGYGQVANIFPVVVVAPRYFAGAIQLGGLMQTASAFGRVQDSLSWFVDAYVSLTEWRATVDRLIGFHEIVQASLAAAALSPTIARGRGPGGTLEVDGLALSLPRQDTPLVEATLRVEPGEWVLMTGPSGSGKSTLFRALAGIWPFGTGAIRLPAEGRLMFLPQKPYMPIATLRAAVSYPSAEGAFTDAEIRSVMVDCGLAVLADNLDESDHWGRRLSPGEQQRVAFVRALLHRPEWLFLDEATAALDPDTEARLYGLVRERLAGTAVVSIGHRAALADFHGRRLAVRRGEDGIGRLEEVTAA